MSACLSNISLVCLLLSWETSFHHGSSIHKASLLRRTVDAAISHLPFIHWTEEFIKSVLDVEALWVPTKWLDFPVATASTGISGSWGCSVLLKIRFLIWVPLFELGAYHYAARLKQYWSLMPVVYVL